MALKPYQSKIIALFIHQELLLAELYFLFSKYYPEHKSFWETMGQEELEHAEWIEYFAYKVPVGDMRFFEERVRTYTVETFIAYVQKLTSQVRFRKPSPEKAFSLALDIEKSLLEKNVFEHFQTGSSDLKSLMTSLKQQTQEHCKTIQEMVSSIRLHPAHA